MKCPDCRLQEHLISICFLFLQLASANTGNQSQPEHCREAQQWPLNGRDLVRDYRGRVLLMTFVSIKHCRSECELTLSRLDSLHKQHFPSVRVLAISPQNELAAEVRAFAWRFPRIRFEHEHKNSPIWGWFQAAHMDQFIFDRCSRHSKKLLASNGSAPEYSSTAKALRMALNEQPCGPCEYDWTKPAPKWPSLHPPVPAKKNQEDGKFVETKQPKTQLVVINTGGLMTAFSREIGSPKDGIGAQKQLAFAEGQRAVGSNHGRQDERANQQSAAVHAFHGAPQQQQQQPDSQQALQRHQQQLAMLEQQRAELVRLQQQQQERERLLREHEERLRQRQVAGAAEQRRYWADQQERERQRQMEQQQQQQQQQSEHHQSQLQPVQHPQMPSSARQEAQHVQQREQPAPVKYGNDPLASRYPYGLGHQRQLQQQQQQRGQQERFMAPQAPSVAEQPPAMQQQAQIPPAGAAETAVEPAPLYPEGSELGDYLGVYDDEWTTEMPSLLQIPKPTKPASPTTPSLQQLDKNFGFELPCTGFSDESCFQQQSQLRPSEVHRCCRGRILFTDQCVHGKCSNLTTQLCCIQRFLQAKLTCCSDERQAETGVGDHFSRCCFDNFVDSDDPCCPRDYSSEQWRSVHELCLPNVEMDLSAVKVPVPLMGTSLITEFDFGKTDKWRFECRYGGHVQQYSFFEQSASEEEGGDGGAEIED